MTPIQNEPDLNISRILLSALLDDSKSRIVDCHVTRKILEPCCVQLKILEPCCVQLKILQPCCVQLKILEPCFVQVEAVMHELCQGQVVLALVRGQSK